MYRGELLEEGKYSVMMLPFKSAADLAQHGVGDLTYTAAPSWTEVLTKDGLIRTGNGIEVELKATKNEAGVIMNVPHTVKAMYNFRRISEVAKDNVSKGVKLGSFDFETYSDKDTGLTSVYSGAWKADDKYVSYYIGDEGCATSLELVRTMMLDMVMSKQGYTFYAHNLGKFDAVLGLDALDSSELTSNILFRDNDIISMEVALHNNIKIYLNDSLLLLNASLASLAKRFDLVDKGTFPYKFINKDTVHYAGEMPSLEYWNDDITTHFYYHNMKENYNSDKPYDIRTETLSYIKGDVEILDNIMHQLADKFAQEFSVDITKHKTIASLAMKVYLTNFYKIDYDIRSLTGSVEKDIRESYQPGLFHFLPGTYDNSYFYDMNSQFPTAMLHDMPVGNPTLETPIHDKEEFYGFVEAHITPPTKERLRILLLQKKKFFPRSFPNGRAMVSKKGFKFELQRDVFTGWFYTEELKAAQDWGYKVDYIHGYRFTRGKNIFTEFVETFFAWKSNKSSPVEVTVGKLMLNTLYARLKSIAHIFPR